MSEMETRRHGGGADAERELALRLTAEVVNSDGLFVETTKCPLHHF